MTESQIIEYKESWRDEYIKWISGFANAQGGTLVIGKNDQGKVVGVENGRRLLEEVPNKVRDILGIFVDLNLCEEKGRQYLEIVVEKYPYPISYKGQYFLRCGSTKQELKGAALDTFLLRKQGRHWDGVPVPRIVVKDLKKETLRYFRKEAQKSNRLSKDIIEENDLHLLEKLQLLEGQYLKRAAVLLFSPEPEMFVPGAFVKIGRFRTNSELLYQNEIRGPLFEQVEKTMDLLFTKYLSEQITYQGIHRREIFPYPEEGLREAILNAIAHKDYGSNSPIQISVHDNGLYIWNDGRLPENWTIDDLLKKHSSRPYNPLIANTFFRAGLVEAWGRGIEKVIHECIEHGCPEPNFDYRESGLMVEFKARAGVIQKQVAPEMTPEMTPENRSETSIKILALVKDNPSITTVSMANKIGVGKSTILRHLEQLKAQGIIKRTGATKKGYWHIIQDKQ
jgi:ATP-dependent DNA helicase RecG